MRHLLRNWRLLCALIACFGLSSTTIQTAVGQGPDLAETVWTLNSNEVVKKVEVDGQGNVYTLSATGLTKRDYEENVLFTVPLTGLATLDIAVNPITEEVYVVGGLNGVFNPPGLSSASSTGGEDGFLAVIDADGDYVSFFNGDGDSPVTCFRAVKYQNGYDDPRPFDDFDGIVAFVGDSGEGPSDSRNMLVGSYAVGAGGFGFQMVDNGGASVGGTGIDIAIPPISGPVTVGIIGAGFVSGSPQNHVAAVDLSGSVIDISTGGGFYAPSGIDVDAAGNFYVCGSQADEGVVTSYDSTISSLWNTTYKINNVSTIATSITVDDYGNYYVGGSHEDGSTGAAYVRKRRTDNSAPIFNSGGRLRCWDLSYPASSCFDIAFDVAEKFLNAETGVPEDDGAGIYIGGKLTAGNGVVYRYSRHYLSYAEQGVTNVTMDQINRVPDVTDQVGDIGEDLWIRNSDDDVVVELFDIRLARVLEIDMSSGVDDTLTILLSQYAPSTLDDFYPVQKIELNSHAGDSLVIIGDDRQDILHRVGYSNGLSEITVEAASDLLIDHAVLSEVSFFDLATLETRFQSGDVELHFDPDASATTAFTGTMDGSSIDDVLVAGIGSWVVDAEGEFGDSGSADVRLHDDAFALSEVDAVAIRMEQGLNDSFADLFVLDSPQVGPFTWLQFQVHFGSSIGDKLQIDADSDFLLNGQRLAGYANQVLGGSLHWTGLGLGDSAEFNGGPGDNQFRTHTGTNHPFTLPLVLNGGGGNDMLFGGNAADVINGDAGNDRMFGGGGNDTMYGGTGNDAMRGEKGNDELFGDAGRDTFDFLGTAGDDQFVIKPDTNTSNDLVDLVTGPNGTDKMHRDFSDLARGVFIATMGGSDTVTVQTGVTIPGYVVFKAGGSDILSNQSNAHWRSITK